MKFLPILLALTASALAAKDPFAELVRPTEALAPEQERAAFHLPAGFEIQLVASELHIQSGNTLRVRLDGSRVEGHTYGQVNPFGLCWDDRGNLFSADCHSSPLYQLLRGAYYPSFGKPHDGLGFAPQTVTHSHGSTAICGPMLVRDTAWPAELQGHVFIGNVQTSRLNHDAIAWHGASSKGAELPDFLTTDDLRPLLDIMLAVPGEDTALLRFALFEKVDVAADVLAKQLPSLVKNLPGIPGAPVRGRQGRAGHLQLSEWRKAHRHSHQPRVPAHGQDFILPLRPRWRAWGACGEEEHRPPARRCDQGRAPRSRAAAQRHGPAHRVGPRGIRRAHWRHRD